MSIWKNTEVRRTALWLLLATAVCSVAAALLYPICGLLTLGLGAVCGTIWYGSTRRRYRELEGMSRDIDRILHGQEQQMLPQQEEGELAILRSEIGKMTVRLRENAQRQQEERVRLADAMADISHQLRTPLTAMRLTLSLLEQEELTPQRRLALMRELKKLTGRMEWLVEALLKMAQLDAGTVVFHPQDTTAAELVRRAAEPLEVPMEVRSIRFTAQAGEERLTCDVPWSTEALGNILKNCMEHAASWVQVTARETAIFTEITVQDDGPGFDPEELPGKPGLYGYGDPIELPCPIELISMGGIICTEQDGKISLHVHAAFADESGAAFGGHFKEGNRVLTTVEMVIGELDHINMSRAIDPERGVPVFTPLQL